MAKRNVTSSNVSMPYTALLSLALTGMMGKGVPSASLADSGLALSPQLKGRMMAG